MKSAFLSTAFGLAAVTHAANPLPLAGRHQPNTYTMELRQAHNHLQPRQAGEILDPLRNGQSFIAQIALGTEHFNLTLDTGSGDVWLVGSNVTCLGGDCNWGKTYDEKSGNFKPYNTPWSVTYGGGGAGNTDSGWTGSADVTLATLTAKTQPIGVADKVTDPQFRGSISGILGIGVTSSTDRIPLMKNFIQEGVLSQPLFALALSRDASGTGSGGFLTLGGIPSPSDPRINATNSPQLVGSWEAAGGVDHPGYTTTFSSIKAGSQGKSLTTFAGVQYTIDNGNPYIEMPTAQADAVAAMYNPPAEKSGGFYYVACNAIAPNLQFGIGGGVLPVNPKDLIGSPNGGKCNTPLHDNGNNNMGLGSPFMKNVIVVFDWGNQKLLFYSRPYYKSEWVAMCGGISKLNQNSSTILYFLIFSNAHDARQGV